MALDERWRAMLRAAMAVRGHREVSATVDAGSVAAAVLSSTGAVYTGICVDTACSLGVCAERAALFAMLTAGDDRVARVLAVRAGGEAVAPCGACRELLAQLRPGEVDDVEVLMDPSTGRVARLGELTPEWWV
ncbi:MAG: cytidine deaminase [Bifidobacterium sp.]|nr:cytidine deaminase [Bifidobacterium sp.]